MLPLEIFVVTYFTMTTKKKKKLSLNDNNFVLILNVMNEKITLSIKVVGIFFFSKILIFIIFFFVL